MNEHLFPNLSKNEGLSKSMDQSKLKFLNSSRISQKSNKLSEEMRVNRYKITPKFMFLFSINFFDFFHHNIIYYFLEVYATFTLKVYNIFNNYI